MKHLTLEQAFELAPKSDQTVVRHNFIYKGLRFINDLGHPSEYRIVSGNKELGMIKYYKGSKLTCYTFK